MSDPISRKAAIEATWKEPSYTDPLNVLTEVRERIEALPSAQPEQRSFSCGQENDLISRQAAIDACLKGKTEGLPATNVACDCCAERIRVLPSAQPEYKMDEWCTDCQEYDQERHCCPRFNKVIRETVEEYKAEHPEPCEDAISRAEAQTALQFAARRYTVSREAHGEGYVEWSDNLISVPDAMNALREVPSVTPKEQRWIPVSKELPDDLDKVNITWINNDPEPYYAFVKGKAFTGSAVFYQGDWYWYSSVTVDVLAEYGRCDAEKMDKGIKVIAWMPLPEPFQGEGEAK